MTASNDMLNEFNSIIITDGNREMSEDDKKKYSEFMRYNFQYPYWDTMVKINDVNDLFINASWIDGVNKKRAYIATQAPKLNTLDYFWRMIVENDVELIVMVTDYYENGNKKAEFYFNQYLNMPYDSGTVVTEMMDRVENNNFVYSTVSALDKNSNKMSTIKHVLFTGWSDNGIPNSDTNCKEDMNTLINLMDKYYENDITSYKQKPIVVHCSAGNGRTGTLILMHQYLTCKKNGINIAIPSLLTNIRYQRSSMVANKEQYKFVYDYFDLL
jgi:protein tyrosine phosphatase